MNEVGTFTVEPGHPALPGHFPGRPIVPGVLLLDHVLEAVLATAPGQRAAGLPSVKFIRPVRPGERVEIACGPVNGGRVAFGCRVGTAEVVRGMILLGAAS